MTKTKKASSNNQQNRKGGANSTKKSRNGSPNENVDRNGNIPSEDRLAPIKETLATQPKAIQSSTLKFSNKALTISMKIDDKRVRIESIKKGTNDTTEDKVPRSAKIDFTLTCSKGVRDSDAFIALETASRNNVTNFQVHATQNILAVAELEVSHLVKERNEIVFDWMAMTAKALIVVHMHRNKELTCVMGEEKAQHLAVIEFLEERALDEFSVQLKYATREELILAYLKHNNANDIIEERRLKGADDNDLAMSLTEPLDDALLTAVAFGLVSLVPTCTTELWSYHLKKRDEKRLDAKLEAAFKAKETTDATESTLAALKDKDDDEHITAGTLRQIFAEKEASFAKRLAKERQQQKAQAKRQARVNSSGGHTGQRPQPNESAPTANGGSSNGNSSRRHRNRRRNRNHQNGNGGNQGGSRNGNNSNAERNS